MMGGGILPDYAIHALAMKETGKAIVPYSTGEKKPGKISYGQSSYGYDLRAGPVWQIFNNAYPLTVIDPKKFDPKCFHEVSISPDAEDNSVAIPPNSFALTESLEEVEVPRSCLVICLGKSTYARCGIIVNVTPLEPEWKGKVTIEVSNTTPLPVKMYAFEGILQMLFLQSADAGIGRAHWEPVGCRTSYKDKNGKYQGQDKLTHPKVD